MSRILAPYADITTDTVSDELLHLKFMEHDRQQRIEKNEDVDISQYPWHVRPATKINFNFKLSKHRMLDPMHLNPAVIQYILNRPKVRELELDLSTYREFTIVREPLDRLISMFNYGRFRQYFFTFFNFAKAVKYHQDNYNFSINWIDSQLEWVNTSITANKTVFKLEEKDQWLPVISDMLGEQVSYPTVNQSVAVFTKNDLTVEEKEFCLDFLKPEYDALNYSVDSIV